MKNLIIKVAKTAIVLWIVVFLLTLTMSLVVGIIETIKTLS